MVIFTKKFRTLDLHLPIVWDKVLKNRFFTPSLKGLRRRRRAQLPAHHLQGSSNIVFDMQQIKLQHMCGTEPFPTEFRAKKYKLEKHFLSKVNRFVVSQSKYFSPQEDFFFIMQNLPVHVPDEDIAEGSSSSTDHFGKLSRHSVVCWSLSSLFLL